MSGVGCRLIQAADLDTVANLLTEGFPNPLSHWQAALSTLRTRSVPDIMPRYGYLLEDKGEVVGVLLLIATAMHHGSELPDGTGLPGDPPPHIRCNGSSWYVRPAYRAYASMLISRALRHRNVTYLNITPAPATFPILKAQGYTCFAEGSHFSLPALKPCWFLTRILESSRLDEAEHRIPENERILLQDHARAGCVALWCETGSTSGPFVFRERRIMGGKLMTAQLVYCRDIQDFVRLAGPIGRFLARRRLPFVMIGTSKTIAGLPGFYYRGKYPMFVRGGPAPRIGDLAYTETALFSV